MIHYDYLNFLKTVNHCYNFTFDLSSMDFDQLYSINSSIYADFDFQNNSHHLILWG